MPWQLLSLNIPKIYFYLLESTGGSFSYSVCQKYTSVCWNPQAAVSEIQYPKAIKPSNNNNNNSSSSCSSVVTNSNSIFAAPGSHLFSFVSKDGQQQQQQVLSSHSSLPSLQSAVLEAMSLPRPSSTGSGYHMMADAYQVAAIFVCLQSSICVVACVSSSPPRHRFPFSRPITHAKPSYLLLSLYISSHVLPI